MTSAAATGRAGARAPTASRSGSRPLGTGALLASIATLAVLASWAGEARSQDAPRRGGVLTWVDHADPGRLDVHTESPGAVQQATAGVFSGLLQMDPVQPSKVAPDRLDPETQRVVTRFAIPEAKLRYPDEDQYWSLARCLVDATNRRRPAWRLPFRADRPPGWLGVLALRGRGLAARLRSNGEPARYRPGLWRSIRGRLPPYPMQPSTGAVMLQMALARFEAGNTYLVGFDQFREGHYWNPEAAALPGHPWSAEREWIGEHIRSGQLRRLE